MDSDEELLVIHGDWPGTTIDGEPGIVSGLLSLYSTVDGGAYFNISTGDPNGPIEESTHLEFLLTSAEADALIEALQNRPPAQQTPS